MEYFAQNNSSPHNDAVFILGLQTGTPQIHAIQYTDASDSLALLAHAKVGSIREQQREHGAAKHIARCGGRQQLGRRRKEGAPLLRVCQDERGGEDLLQRVELRARLQHLLEKLDL